MAISFDTTNHVVFDGDIAWAKYDFNPMIDEVNSGFLQIETALTSLFSGSPFETTCREILYGPPSNQVYSCKDISDMLHDMVCFDGTGNILNGVTSTFYPSIKRMHTVAKQYNDQDSQYVHNPADDTADGPTISSCSNIAEMHTTGIRNGVIVPALYGYSYASEYSINAIYSEAYDITWEVQADVLGSNGISSGKMSVESIIEAMSS